MQIDAFNTDIPACEEDRAGAKVLESGIYQASIKLAYLENVGQAGSKKLIIQYAIEDEGDIVTLRDEEIVLNKEGKNVCKDGKKLLPGFLKMNAVCVCASGADLGKQVFEDKDIEVYKQGEKVVEKKLVATTLLNKTLLVGVQKGTMSRKQKQGNDWVFTDKTFMGNRIDKAFSSDGKTHKEILNKAEPSFINIWKEKNEGKENNFVPTDVKPWITQTGSPLSGKPAKSIFAK